MQISAETRWFWSGLPAPKIEMWFVGETQHTCSAGGGEPRVDEYLCDRNQFELGLKKRGGKLGVEVKGLVSDRWGQLSAGPFSAPIELWTKWASEILELKEALVIPIEKTRWIRKFDTSADPPHEIPLDRNERPVGSSALPILGCNVELTRIKLPDGASWWTLGFEAFGTITTVSKSLEIAARELAGRHPPELAEGFIASYPAWLVKHVFTKATVVG